MPITTDMNFASFPHSLKNRENGSICAGLGEVIKDY